MEARLSSSAWAAVCDGLDVGVWLVDGLALRILYANDAAARLVGRPVESMVGLPVRTLADTPEDHIFWSQSAQEVSVGIQSYTSVRHAESGRLVPVERRVRTLQGHQDLLVLTMLDRSEHEASERELESLLSELRATLDSAADGVLTCNLQGEIRAFNHRLAQIWEIPRALLVRRDDAAIREHMEAQVVDREGYRARLATIAAEPLLETMDVLHLRNGTTIERSSVPQLIKGRPAGRVFSFRDISRQAEVQAGLRLAARVFESSLDAIFIANEHHTIARVNPGCERLLGAEAQTFVGRPAHILLSADHNVDAFMAQVAEGWNLRGFWEGELLVTRQDGTRCAVQLSWVALRDGKGVITQSIGFMRDLTPQRTAQRRIEELAYRDVLTGLPNRLLLGQRVMAAIDGVSIRGGSFAILFLDLDRFKIINDSLGHPFGDRVLQLVARRLQECLRQSDMLCRLGGDEFVIYLHDADAAVAEAVARHMLDEMASPFVLDELGFSIQCSIGVALYPRDGTTLDDLIKQADTAMYRVKERGRGSYGFYEPQMNAHLLSRMKMEHAMRQALGQGHMAVHYQPQIGIADGRIVGAEALIRWTDPELGAVSPAVFIPLAEESGYIVTLGAWVMEQAVREAAAWRRLGMHLPVSVNVSALEFRQTGFVERVTGVLAEHGLPPDQLELELTETVLLQDAAEMEQRLHALSQLGVRLSIDDFGTGYSSLAYLKKLDIHKLKIDKSFVSGLPGDEGDQAIVRAIASMGRALRIEVVAEGVETEEQRRALQDMDCACYQGFLSAPALPAEDFRALLARQYGNTGNGWKGEDAARQGHEEKVSANATGPAS